MVKNINQAFPGMSTGDIIDLMRTQGPENRKFDYSLAPQPVDFKEYDQSLLSNLIGQDPLFDVYKNQGLLDPHNIQPYKNDPFRDPTSTEYEKNLLADAQSTYGYTRPQNNQVSFIDKLEEFGNKPTGPLRGASIMDDAYLDAESYITQVAKPGGETRRLTNREKINQDLNSPYDWRRQGARQDIFGSYTSPEDIAKYPDIYGEYKPGFDKSAWPVEPTITERNKQIAETIGHEARHHLLHPVAERYTSQIIGDDDSFPGYYDKEESLNRMLDFQAYNNPGIYSTIYDDMEMPRNLTNRYTDSLSNAADAFTAEMLGGDVNFGITKLTDAKKFGMLRNMLNRQKAGKTIPTNNLHTLQAQTAAQEKAKMAGQVAAAQNASDRQNIQNIQKYTGSSLSDHRMSQPASQRNYTGAGKSGMGRNNPYYADGGIASMFTRRG
jgi:hypothetical protein